MKRVKASLVAFCYSTLTCLFLTFGDGWVLGQQAPNFVTIMGHVEDASGASMAGVQITLRDANSAVSEE